MTSPQISRHFEQALAAEKMMAEMETIAIQVAATQGLKLVGRLQDSLFFESTP